MSSENPKKRKEEDFHVRVFDAVAGTIYLSFAYLCVKKIISQCYGSNAQMHVC